MLTKHKFQSQKADGTDVTLVKPSNWNDDHDMTTSTDGVALGRPVGAGPGPVQELPLSALMPTGVMMLWPGAAAPLGWMICAGQSLSRAANPTLFAVIGTSYGAVDGSSFSLPDLRGTVAAGVDGGAGRLTGNTIGGAGPNAVGGRGGVEYNDSGVTNASLALNRGDAFVSNVGQVGQIITSVESMSLPSINESVGGGQGGPSSFASTGHTHTAQSRAVNVQSTLNDTSVGGYHGYVRAFTVQPTLMVNYIIKV